MPSAIADGCHRPIGGWGGRAGPAHPADRLRPCARCGEGAWCDDDDGVCTGGGPTRMRAHTRTLARTHAHARTHMHANTCTHAHMHTRKHASACTHTHARTLMQARPHSTHLHAPARTHACTHAYAYARARARTFMHIHAPDELTASGRGSNIVPTTASRSASPYLQPGVPGKAEFRRCRLQMRMNRRGNRSPWRGNGPHWGLVEVGWAEVGAGLSGSGPKWGSHLIVAL